MRRTHRVNRILIADNHPFFRRGLRALFSAESDLEVVAEVSTVEEVFDAIRSATPDIIVLDLALLQLAPADAALRLRQSHTSSGLLILTQEDGAEELALALSAGAKGYMLKNSTPVELIAGVRRVITGTDQSSGQIANVVPDLRALAASSEKYGRGPVLTSREQEVVRLLAEGRTVREVAAELCLSVKTIEAHKLNLMRKLDIHDRASLIQYAVRSNLIPAELVR